MRNGKKPPFQNHFWNYPPPNPTFVKLLNTGRNLISLLNKNAVESREEFQGPEKKLVDYRVHLPEREFNLKTFPIFLFIVFWKLSRPSKRKFRGKKRKIYIFRSEIWEAERGESNSGFPVCLVIAWNRGVHFFSFSGFSWEREGWPPINFRGGESPFLWRIPQNFFENLFHPISFSHMNVYPINIGYFSPGKPRSGSDRSFV